MLGPQHIEPEQQPNPITKKQAWGSTVVPVEVLLPEHCCGYGSKPGWFWGAFLAVFDDGKSSWDDGKSNMNDQILDRSCCEMPFDCSFELSAL